MRHGEDQRIIECPACLPRAVAKLGAQVAPGEHRAGLVNLQARGRRQRSRHFVGHDEIRPQMPGQWTLCSLNEPPSVADQLRRAPSVQLIEKALNLLETLCGGIIPLIPYPQAQMLEL